MNAETTPVAAVTPKGPFETKAEYQKRVHATRDVDLGKDPETITLTVQVVRQSERFQVSGQGKNETGMPGDFIARYKGPDGTYSKEFVLPAEIVLGYSNLRGKALEVAKAPDTDSAHMRTPVLSVPGLHNMDKAEGARRDAATEHDKKAIAYQKADPLERGALRVAARDKVDPLTGKREEGGPLHGRAGVGSGSGRGVVAVPAGGQSSTVATRSTSSQGGVVAQPAKAATKGNTPATPAKR